MALAGCFMKPGLLKKTLTSKISDGAIDAYYQRGLDAGALGGKLVGAGGGGFLLFYCPATGSKTGFSQQ